LDIFPVEISGNTFADILAIALRANVSATKDLLGKCHPGKFLSDKYPLIKCICRCLPGESSPDKCSLGKCFSELRLTLDSGGRFPEKPVIALRKMIVDEILNPNFSMAYF
jgi:hypothetical protein